MKRMMITVFVIAIALCFNNSISAQNKDEKKKEKKLVIKIDKEENGKITKVDTTIILKEGDNPDKILEQYGAKNDKGMKHVKGYKIKLDDGDSSKIRKEEKMVWVTVSDDDSDTTKCEKISKVVIISDDDEGDVMHMEGGNVMIMRNPHGNAVYHVKEFNGKHGNDSVFFEKNIIIDDQDMPRRHRKAFKYRNEAGNNGDNVVILSDIEGPLMEPMFMRDMNDNSDSTIVIVKTYKDGKEITETKRVMRNEKKENRVSIKVTDAEKADLQILTLKENYKKLEIKDLNIALNDNKMQINFELSAKDNTAIKIIDKAGKSVFAEELKQFQGKYSKEIQALKGEFYIQVNQGNKYYVKKVIIDFN